MENEKPVMSYKDLSSFELNQTLMKIANTPMSTAKAIVLRKTITAIQKIKDKISSDYKAEIYDVYFQKDEAGKLKMDENQQPIPLEGKEDEIKRLTEEFGKRTFELTSQIRPSMLSDVKQISPREVEVLGNLLADEDGPGLPEFPQGQNRGNVTELRN